MALVDSGAGGKFMDADFAKIHNLPLPLISLSHPSPLVVAALYGRQLGAGPVQHTISDICLTTGIMHSEVINFFIIQASHSRTSLAFTT